MSATPLTEFLAVRASVTVVPGLTLSGWYFDPIVGPRPVRTGQKVGRNDPCPCGSGKKYKHCHGKLS